MNQEVREERAKEMVDPLSLTVVTALLIKSAPIWLPSIRDAFISKGAEFVIDTTLKGGRSLLGRDEKEQVRHLELALKNAVERGLAQFHTRQERDQYRSILTYLSEPSTQNDLLRREALHLFTLSDSPDFTELTEKYNLRQRISALAKHSQHEEVDAAPYLSSFFQALIAELYVDPFFRQQVSNVLQVRAAMSMQRSLTEVVSTLHQMSEYLVDDYTTGQFEQDVETYAAHIERTLHYLKLVGIVPKDRGNRNVDPELNGIFVPLRIALQDQTLPNEGKRDSIIALLEYYPYLVVLGGPGSGKSTAVRYLAWSHALANQANSLESTITLFSGNPLPLRIELRRLTEDRRHHPNYDFLSYAREVLLGREGVKIHPQMFKQLLERRTMLLLFDGLDEVATLDERNRLVEEIEHFALYYPGNRILVTSRPVGYELARFSNQWFSHAHVQEFNDEQIREFLERCYTHVLRLSPIPHEDRQELEVLLTTLQKNPRLHKLAENPLLLTVITALHRYERLPDRRVLVYDRCADLLLETWARLKGTDARWKDMKMIKEDQSACVAHLGFVLHERSQEKESNNGDATEDNANDVPTRFMLRQVEHFLNSRNLITEVAEQRAEAKRFLDLIQVEAGLIVERGTDESGESLYGFVHRTFQEYFAAADVNERYLQKTDLTIISNFLREHLHDPHWHEVILLLLGKLKRQPATSQLRLILEGKIKSLRSHYTEIVQQDLFFICECLMEEIIVEPDLAEMVVDRLEQIIKHSLFSSQRQQAINFLCTLTQTRLYGSVARKEIIKLVTQDNLQDLDLRKEFARRFYQIPTITPEEKQQIGQALLRLAQQPDLSIQQSVDILRLLYLESPLESEERKQSAQRLLTLLQRPGPLDWQVVGIAGDFYEKSPPESEERQQVTQLLLNMMRNTNLSIDERLQRASMFYKRNRRSSSLSPINSNKHAQVSRMLLDWLHEPQLSFEENFAIAQFLYQISTTSSEELHQAIQILSTIAQQASLSHDQILQIAEALYNDPSDKSEGKQEANRILFNLAQQPHLPFEVKLQIIKTIGRENSPNSEEWRQADQMLLSLIQEPRLSVEQILHIDRLFSQYRFSGESEAWPQLIQPLFDVLYQQELSIDSSLAISRILYWEAARQSEEREKLVQMLLSLTKRPDATTEDILKIAGLFGHDAPIEDQERGVGLLFELSQRNDLSLEQKVSVAHDLYFSSSLHVTYRQAAITMISELLSTPELPFNLEYKILQTYYGYQDVEEQISIRQRLWQLVEGQNIAIDQKLEVVSIPLYSREASCAEIIKSIQIAIRLLGIDMVKQYISSWGG